MLGCTRHVGSSPGKGLWTLRGSQVIEETAAEISPLSSGALRAAFKKHGMTVRCCPRQLTQFVTRHNREIRAVACTPAGGVTVEELLRACAQWQPQGPHDWSEAPMDQLQVIGSPVANAQRVCICWTCRGMLRTLEGPKVM